MIKAEFYGVETRRLHKQKAVIRSIQINDSYPFGMFTRSQPSIGGQTGDSWVANNTEVNNYLYNASSELNKSTNNYQTFFRDGAYPPGGRDPIGFNACPSAVQRRQDPTGADPYAASNPPGWRFENGDWYDNRPQGYFQDYRGSNGNNNAFFGGLTPGSVGDWANGIRGTGANMAVMSNSELKSFEGIDLWNLNDQQRANLARSLGTTYSGFEWVDPPTKTTVYRDSNGQVTEIEASADQSYLNATKVGQNRTDKWLLRHYYTGSGYTVSGDKNVGIHLKGILR